jgi:hypothetical protein
MYLNYNSFANVYGYCQNHLIFQWLEKSTDLQINHQSLIFTMVSTKTIDIGQCGLQICDAQKGYVA